MTHYTDYYDSQIGGGYSTKFRVFAGSPHQRGHGIGSFLGGLFRRVLPLLSRGARAVGKEAVRAGMNILTDVSERGAPLKQAFRTRAAESGMNLKRKAETKIDELMKGSGYKSVKRSRGAHSIIGVAGRSIASRTANKRKRRTGKKAAPRRKKKVVKKIKSKTKKPKNRRRIASKKVKRSVLDIFS